MEYSQWFSIVTVRWALLVGSMKLFVRPSFVFCTQDTPSRENKKWDYEMTVNDHVCVVR